MDICSRRPSGRIKISNFRIIEFRIEKAMKKKGGKLYVKWKGYDNPFHSWIDKKKILLYKMDYFPEPYTDSKSKINAELDLSCYSRKSVLKSATSISTLIH